MVISFAREKVDSFQNMIFLFGCSLNDRITVQLVVTHQSQTVLSINFACFGNFFIYLEVFLL